MSSSISRLLRTNNSPSPQEIIVVQQVIQNAETELSFTPNSERKAELKQIISTQRAVISPWRNIPLELLNLIFFFTRDSRHPGPIQRLPVTAQVCRLWRDVALVAPPLWSDVSLDLTTKAPSDNGHKLLELLLERSRDNPLRVYISVTELYRTKSAMFQELIRHSNRWETAKIYISSATIGSLNPIRGQLNLLHTVELEASPEGPPFPIIPCILFCVALRLRSFSLSGDWGGMGFFLDWQPLKLYKTGAIRPGHPYPLEHLTSVETLDIQWANANAHGYAGYSSITMPSVHHLRINFIERGQTGKTFFDLVRLPNIHKLQLDGYVVDLLRHAEALLSPSPSLLGNHLREFTCLSPLTGPGQLTEFLLLAPHLEVLEIRIPHVLDLDLLRIVPNRRPLVPNLHTLRLVGQTIAEDSTSLRTVAWSRCEWPDRTIYFGEDEKGSVLLKRLHRLSVEFTDVAGKDVAEEEREFLEEAGSPNSLKGRYRRPGEASDAVNHVGKMRQWRETIILAFSSILQNSKGPERVKRLEAMDTTLCAIEAFEVTDVRHIYLSRLHMTLHRLKTADMVPGGRKYDLQSRAANILDKWAPLLLGDAKNRRWMVVGQNVLTYVPKSYFSDESTNIQNIIYGQRGGTEMI